ncbi:MAG: hypothetical protein AVDCRST_MAG68-5596, partial [uncultured Gemmatimonadetes bacterium]
EALSPPHRPIPGRRAGRGGPRRAVGRPATRADAGAPRHRSASGAARHRAPAAPRHRPGAGAAGGIAGRHPPRPRAGGQHRPRHGGGRLAGPRAQLPGVPGGGDAGLRPGGVGVRARGAQPLPRAQPAGAAGPHPRAGDHALRQLRAAGGRVVPGRRGRALPRLPGRVGDASAERLHLRPAAHPAGGRRGDAGGARPGRGAGGPRHLPPLGPARPGAGGGRGRRLQHAHPARLLLAPAGAALPGAGGAGRVRELGLPPLRSVRHQHADGAPGLPVPPGPGAAARLPPIRHRHGAAERLRGLPHREPGPRRADPARPGALPAAPVGGRRRRPQHGKPGRERHPQRRGPLPPGPRPRHDGPRHRQRLRRPPPPSWRGGVVRARRQRALRPRRAGARALAGRARRGAPPHLWRRRRRGDGGDGARGAVRRHHRVRAHRRGGAAHPLPGRHPAHAADLWRAGRPRAPHRDGHRQRDPNGQPRARGGPARRGAGARRVPGRRGAGRAQPRHRHAVRAPVRPGLRRHGRGRAHGHRGIRRLPRLFRPGALRRLVRARAGKQRAPLPAELLWARRARVPQPLPHGQPGAHPAPGGAGPRTRPRPRRGPGQRGGGAPLRHREPVRPGPGRGRARLLPPGQRLRPARHRDPRYPDPRHPRHVRGALVLPQL